MLGIGKGDEVITAANSFIATAESITAVGARPVFVDVDNYYTIDAEKIEEKITNKTRALIAVHLYGQAAQIDVISEICNKHNIFLIEDSAQAHFSEFHNQYCGTFGVAACFSFYPAKNIGAFGDGGCIVTNDDKLAQNIRMYTNHGSKEKHVHVFEGINSRLDGIQAGILKIKLKYIDQWNQERLYAANYYTKLLSNIELVNTPEIRNNTLHTFHLYVIKTNQRDELQKYLLSKGIETGIHYPYALPFMPCYKYLNHVVNDFKFAYYNQDRIISLPIFPGMKNEQIEYVYEMIKEFYKKN